jgi:membrane protease YdiL (CAAX protease family)
MPDNPNPTDNPRIESPGPSVAAPTNASLAKPRGTLANVFVGEQGLRFIWGVLLFVALFLLLLTGVELALGKFIPPRPPDPTPPKLALLLESSELLVILFATWLMALIEKRPFSVYGYRAPDKFTRLITGALWGFACLSLLVGLLWRTGFLVFDGQALHGLDIWKYGLIWALLFLIVGLSEESLLRGYLQYTLTRGLGFWWAAVLLSIAFGLLHFGNTGESWLGLLSVMTGGFVFCLSLWYTKSLWWAIGFHAGWDWAQSYFYGTADSGLHMQGHLFAEHAAGKPLWSGGTVGPEGSLLQFPLLLLLILGMGLWWGRQSRYTNAPTAQNPESGSFVEPLPPTERAGSAPTLST